MKEKNSVSEMPKILLSFPPEVAERILDTNSIIIKPENSVTEIAEKISRRLKKTDRVPTVLLSNKTSNILGYIPHKRLLVSPPHTLASSLQTEIPLITPNDKPGHVLNLARHHEVIALIDNHTNKNLLGIIHPHDTLYLAHHEAGRHLQKFAGIGPEEGIFDPVLSKVKHRSRWLVVNLGTAFLASSVVSFFTDSITQIALLAVFMPIVAGQGGNAATQALAIMVRGLAIGNISWSDARGIIAREAVAGLINGCIVGSLSSILAAAFNAPPLLGVILGLSMVFNLFIAGLFGALVPFILKSLRIDPATASSIFVTTATDTFGFLAFLGLSTIFLL